MCGGLTAKAAAKVGVYSMWQKNTGRCRKRLCYVEVTNGEACEKVCARHMPPWVRGKLQTKPWDRRDSKMASMLAVGEIAASDCSAARGLGMVECMPTFAPAWKAQVVQRSVPRRRRSRGNLYLDDDARGKEIKPENLQLDV